MFGVKIKTIPATLLEKFSQIGNKYLTSYSHGNFKEQKPGPWLTKYVISLQGTCLRNKPVDTQTEKIWHDF